MSDEFDRLDESALHESDVAVFLITELNKASRPNVLPTGGPAVPGRRSSGLVLLKRSARTFAHRAASLRWRANCRDSAEAEMNQRRQTTQAVSLRSSLVGNPRGTIRCNIRV